MRTLLNGKRPRRRGFTLLELSMALAVSGLVLSFVLQATQSASSNSCYGITQAQLPVIREAIEKFARNTNRLPLPAARNIGVENVLYGRESSGANIDAAGGVSFGALPFQALGLSSDYAGDCWGNKFTYVVTTALTAANALSGVTLGNISIYSTDAVTRSTTAAYAVISHGKDELGAVKLNYVAANPTHGWCSAPGGTHPKYMNCKATAATVADASFNNGKDANDSVYFDDIIAVAGRPEIPTVAANCSLPWGGTIAVAASVTAYQSNSPGTGSCVSETRTCTAPGVLSGSYAYGTCASGCTATAITWTGATAGYCDAVTPLLTSGATTTVMNTDPMQGGWIDVTCTNGVISQAPDHVPGGSVCW